jgi:hypothetical protein
LDVGCALVYVEQVVHDSIAFWLVETLDADHKQAIDEKCLKSCDRVRAHERVNAQNRLGDRVRILFVLVRVEGSIYATAYMLA